ncbi:MAG: hypothetical protein PWP67_3015 [Clostridium butyricum]|jgi:glycosyltransferase involved in cell wall biosynthesis|uniref:Glycosyltransferase n=1 Tax=Clostridium butyricum TaxID=1492 RepID=A0A512TLN2_CLOBU|nr:glycosyltransferase [Clostridium butyricum]MDK2830180.1 hypothetical protein [Clostridium butyricum]NAS17098.1 glycosyltransferase [Clostridium butyricum]NOW22540.1 glycosyltransferase involved in cell wall biosynthesis [Clostridium butyricum]GEQ21170.1 hypothetical protein CBU02nite_16760 [Clostridium butyricum]
MVKLSVIVPVYNVELYIDDCIKSLLNQTIEDMEIIVVDDGCTDDSIKKLKKYNDGRIKIIHKKNGGLSSARNFGFKYATGIYVAFVDSDDLINNKNSFKEMFDLGIETDADVIVGNSSWYYSENKRHTYKRNRKIFYYGNIMSGEEYIVNFMKKNCMLRTVWTNIYKKKLLIDNNITFKEGILHEDELFTPQVFINSKKIIIYDKEFYMYRQRTGSIMNSNNEIKRCEDMIYICRELNDKIRKIKNIKLKYVLGDHINNLLFKTIYDNRNLNIDKDLLDIVYQNSYKIKQKLKLYALSKNKEVFYALEKIDRIKSRVNKMFNF